MSVAAVFAGSAQRNFVQHGYVVAHHRGFAQSPTRWRGRSKFRCRCAPPDGCPWRILRCYGFAYIAPIRGADFATTSARLGATATPDNPCNKETAGSGSRKRVAVTECQQVVDGVMQQRRVVVVGVVDNFSQFLFGESRARQFLRQ